MAIRKDQTIDIRSNTQKQNIEQHEPHIKPGVNCCVLEGTAVLAVATNGVRRTRGNVIYYLHIYV